MVTGDSDHVIAPAMAERYHALIADSELLVMPQTGHLPQEERPDAVIAAITRFVETH